MKLYIDPQLAREVVLTTIQNQPEAAGEYRERADSIYALPIPRRETAFGRLHGELFHRWGLDQVPHQVAAQYSHLEPPVDTLYLSAAGNPGEEEALLSRQRSKVGIKLCPSRFLEPAGMEGTLHHQLTHMNDAIHHGFTVPSGRLGGGGVAIRERYLVLWDTYIDGRLESQGKSGAEPREARLSQFQASFPHLPPEAALACFQGLWQAPEMSHATILSWAEEPACLAPAPQSVGPTPGARCPLCSFPTHDWAAPDPRLAELVSADFPLWRPEQGMCGRCAELYQVRAGIW